MVKVYLSSTYRDLRDYRDAVTAILRKGGIEVVAMEDYVASGQHPPLDKCLADVAGCDGYVGLFAWKYGYVPAENNPEQQSITELEYRHAEHLGKACFIFLLDEGAAWSPQQMDQVTGEGKGGQLITRLRQDLSTAKLVSFFKKPDELAGLVSAAIQHWQSEQRTAAEPEADIEGPFEDVCPYVGLEAFNAKTARFFMGRDLFLQRLLNKLTESNFVPVIGASGSGKSSLVRAGLIPHLAERLDWQVLPPVKPGDSPLDPVNEISRVLIQLCKRDWEKTQVALALEQGQLGQAISALPGSQKLLLVVDQFEEIFTVCPAEKEAERQQFLDLLVSMVQPSATETSSRLWVVTTMRADFFEECLKYRDLGEVIQAHQVLLLPMTEAELTEAIARPATTVGYRLGSGLLTAILRDVRGEQNILPLLEFALTQVWERRDKRTLTFEAYDALGGVMGALNQHAEEIYDSLSDIEQSWAKRICLKLVRTGQGEKDTRQRLPKADLLKLAREEQRSLLESTLKELVDGRLLATGRSSQPGTTETVNTPQSATDHNNKASWVDLSHEALMQGWKRFREWRQADRDRRRLIQRVEDAAKEWHQKQQVEGYLLQGGLLATVREQWNALAPELVQSTQQYFQKSDQREQDLERVLTEAKLREEAIQILNLTVARPQPDIATRAIKSVGISHNKLHGHILTPLQGNLPIVIARIRECGQFQRHLSSVNSVTFSPDGQTIVSGSTDKTVRLWDREGNPIGEPFQGHLSSVNSVAFSSDGKIIVSGSSDDTVRLWDFWGNPISKPFQGHSAYVNSVAFSPDGQTIVSGSTDKTVRLWDLEGNPIGEPFQGHLDSVNSVAFNPDGKTIVSGSSDDTVRLWDLGGNSLSEPFLEHSAYINSVAFSPDGQTIVSGSTDKTVRLWDLEGNPIGEPFQGHLDSVNSVAFSPDGKTLVSGSWDKTVRLWNLGGNLISEPFQGHSAYVQSVAFSPDGQTIVSGSWDRTVRLWDLEGNSMDETLQGHLSSVNSVAFSPRGKTIVSGSSDRTVRLWDLEGNPIGEPFQGHSASVNSVAFSPDGRTIVSGSWDRTVRLWDLEGNPIGKPFQGASYSVWSVAFSPDGKTIVSGSDDNTVRLSDLEGNPIGEPFQGHLAAVWSVAFSPDGRTIVSGSDDKTVRLWDLEGNPICEPFQGHSAAVNSVAFSPDGRTIVSGSWDQTVQLWDLEGNPISEPFQGHFAAVRSVTFSPDGQTIVSGSWDQTVRLWDLRGNPISEPFQGHSAYVNSVAFSPDGHTIVSGSSDCTVRLWHGHWRAWLAICCNRLRHHPIFKVPPTTSPAKPVKSVSA